MILFDSTNSFILIKNVFLPVLQITNETNKLLNLKVSKHELCSYLHNEDLTDDQF